MMQPAAIMETEERREFATVRDYLKTIAAKQRLAKSLRRKRGWTPEARQKALAHLELPDLGWKIQQRVANNRPLITAAHIIYGEMRNRPHMKDTDRYKGYVSFMKRRLGIDPAGLTE